MPENKRTLPDRMADELIARIFIGEYAPGDRLPAERALASELGVDRTSLRMAVRQLARLKVVRAVRGSGVTVLDFKRHAGLDFLAAVLEVPGLHLGGAFLLEALGNWERALPTIVADALQRATPSDLATMDAYLAQQLAGLERGDALAEVAAIAVDMQDHIVATLADVTFRLFANSTRALRLELTRLHYELSDPREMLERERAMLSLALSTVADPGAIREAHGAYLRAQHAPLRSHLAQLPPRPWRTSRWESPAAEARRRSES